MKNAIAPYLAATFLLTLSPITKAEPTQICQYDPTLGVPNPLGMRNYLTITEEDGDTTFVFEQFPAEIGDDEISVTFAATHRMTFYETGVEEARSLMLQHPYYYSNLTGYQDPGFDLVNAVITCSPPDTGLK